MTSEPARAARSTLRARLHEKLPEILIEAASVVLALLLALALNAWNERREEHERADNARAAILSELGENRKEIEDARPRLASIVADLAAAAAEPDGASNDALQINLGLSLLSAAAWHAALATQATQTIDFAWITRVAKVYELQDDYLRVQNAMLDQLGSIPPDKNLSRATLAKTLMSRLATMSQLAEGLSRSYDDVLGKASGPSR